MDLIRLKSFPSVAASAISSLSTDELTDYGVYALIFERNAANTNANMTNIRVRQNGKDLINGITGTRLAAMNVYDGMPDTANYTGLYFGDPTARSIRGQHLGDLDLSIYRGPIEIEVTLGAAVGPTLQMYARAGVPKANMGLGYSPQEAAAFRAYIRTVITEAAAVTRKQYGVSLGSSSGALIRKLHLFHTNLTSVDFKKQSLIKWDDVSVALNAMVAAQEGRVPAAGQYVLDRIVDGNIGEAEPTVQQDGRPWNLNLALTLSAADTVTAFADVLTNGRAL
jgi:hypothetical protein